jgi:excinuclease UvrABC nuclease subunit
MDLQEIINLGAITKIPFQPWQHSMNEYDFESTLVFVGGGIYRMYNAEDEIIYVGKSNDIHRRLLQHIGKRTNSAYFIEEASRIEYHVNNDPVFQTLLEGIFIALHTPKYNDEVKDRRKSQ